MVVEAPLPPISPVGGSGAEPLIGFGAYIPHILPLQGIRDA